MTTEPKKILLICLQGIGNTLLALPLAAGLKGRYPDSRTTLLSSTLRIEKVALAHSGIDDFLARSESHAALISDLRRRKFDLALAPFPSGWKSHTLALLAGIPKRVGHLIPGVRSFGLNIKVPMEEGAHDLIQNMNLAGAVDAFTDPAPYWPPLADIPEDIRQAASALLVKLGGNPQRRYLGIHTGSDSRFAQKRWPLEKFAETAGNAYRQFGLPALIFDGPAEKNSGRTVAEMAETPVIFMDGQGDFTDAWGMLGFCDAFVSNDSGLMNLASASGVPTVGVFGPSQMNRTFPWGGRSVKSDLPCSPCYTLTRYQGCIYDSNRCMEELPVEPVMEAIGKVLGR